MGDKKLKKPINQVARKVGMQNQYLAHAINDGNVVGEVVNGGDYHSDNSWVDIDSLKKYIQWKCDNFVISKENCVKYLEFLNNLNE